MFLSPVSVFSEVAPSDSEQASQSVPMVSTSTPGLPVPGAAATGEERDDGLLEPDADRLELLLCPYLILMYHFSGLICLFSLLLYSRSSGEVSLDPVVSQGSVEEPSQQSDKTNMPSTSQEPSSSSAGMSLELTPLQMLYSFIPSPAASSDTRILYFIYLFRHKQCSTETFQTRTRPSAAALARTPRWPWKERR